MKITIIGPAHPFRGGLAAYNERLAKEFISQGHDVNLYTFTTQYPNFLFPGKTQFSQEEAPKDLKIERILSSVNPFNWMKVGNRIKKERPDIVIIRYWLPFMGPSFGCVLRRIKKNKHTKIVCLVDNIIPHEKRIGDRMFTKYFVKPIDGFLAMSENVYKDIEKFTSTKKLLSPHPLFDNFGKGIPRDEAIKKIGGNPDNKYIMFFGLIRKYKGLDLLLNAFADGRFRDSGIKLIIAGEFYVDKEEYIKLIDTLKLNDDIILADRFIEDSEVKTFFSAADLVVQPYRSATQSGVTQIAYHFNKPMVVTNVGGLEELCPDGKVGYVVPVEPHAIADAIFRYFNETDHTHIQACIEEEKKKYSWEILANNLLNLGE